METMNDTLAPNVINNSPNRELMNDKYGIDFAFFFLIIPLILIFIYILLWLFPQLEYIFVLQLSNPTVTSIYLSNYAHVSFWHLLNNLTGYCVLIYLILTFEIDRKRFYTNMILFFTALPLLRFASIAYWTNIPASIGFSCIVSGFLGYLTYSVYNYIKMYWNIHLDYRFPLSILLFNLLFITSIYKWMQQFLVLLLLFLFMIIMIRNSIKNLFYKIYNMCISRKTKKFKNIMIFLFTICFILFGSFSLFPANIGQTNILSHYVGYGFGVLAPLLFTEPLLKIIEKWKYIGG